MMKDIVILLLISCILSACSKDIPFENVKWLEKDEVDYPYRHRMIDDLLENHRLQGLSYRQLTELLGQPEKYDTKEKIIYDIEQEYGTDIDPVYVKYLAFTLDKDSVVIDYELKEFKK
jgi:hypothetical protein